MKIAILGAGITGLTAAYCLTKKGCKVTVFEKEPIPGGLASGFKNKNWEWPIERFYHHFFTSDKETINLIRELEQGKNLLFPTPLTATYYQGQIYQLDSPFSLLKFPYLSLGEKIRTGVVIAYLKLLSNYQPLEQTTAEKWLKKKMGEESFKILWQPLLAGKFSDFAPQVSAAWFWARIKKRSRSLGYIKGGFQTLTDRLVEKIEENGGKILLNTEVQKIKTHNSRFIIHPPTGEAGDSLFDVVISTLPTPIFLNIAPFLPEDYRNRLSQIPHLWAQTLVLELKRPFLEKVYWLNINDTSFPFLAVVEHTNFISRSNYNNHSILYIGNYLPNGHPYLKKTRGEILKIFCPYLKKINPDFNYKLSIINYKLFSAPYAQSVITVGYRPPELQTPAQNLYLANLDCVYPWDRGINYAIELGNKVAKLVEVGNK